MKVVGLAALLMSAMVVAGTAGADVDGGPVRVSGPGTLYPNAEVQPDLAVHRHPRADRPVPGSLYLGDRHGLVAAGPAFIPFFPAPTNGKPDNPTDIFTASLPAG